MPNHNHNNSHHRGHNDYHLTFDQRRLIEFYMNELNATNNHINHLYRVQESLRQSISDIYFQRRTPRPQDFTTNHASYALQSDNLIRSARRPRPQPLQTQTTGGGLSNILSNFFSSVPVAPTAEQFQRATQTLLFRDIAAPINDTCPISLERFTADELVTTIRFCGHVFRTNELNNWFLSNVRCPVCRYDIRNFESPSAAPTQAASPVGETSANANANANATATSDALSEGLSALADTAISEIMSNIFPRRSNDRFIFDPSQNMLYFETVINNLPLR